MSENTKSGHAVWEGQGLAFRAIGGSGYQVRFDSPAGPDGGSPMELVALASAGCTASDVISILQKKQQAVTEFEVNVLARRASDHPKVFTEIDLEYAVTGHGIDPQAVEVTRFSLSLKALEDLRARTAGFTRPAYTLPAQPIGYF